MAEQTTYRIPRRSGTELTPLSAAQKRLWILQQFDRESASSNRPLAIRLSGPLDERALSLSLNEIVRRHEVLRTVFPDLGGEPIQVVSPAQPLFFELRDLRDLPAKEAAARSIAAQEAQRVFDLAKGPLVRVVLLRLDNEDHVLLLLMHHIIFDGWSEGIMLSELGALYETFSAGQNTPALPDVPIQYADFAVWQDNRLAQGSLGEHLAYWERQLAGLAPLALPTDYPRGNESISKGSIQSLLLPIALAHQLKELSRQERVTLFMTLLTAFQVLLSRYSGQEDFAVGVPIAGRTELETEGLIGCFMNVLVLRTVLSENPSFHEMLSQTRDTALKAYTHQEVPFEKLVEELRPERSANRWPLFQVMFNFRNLPLIAAKQAGSLRLEPFCFDSELIGGLDLSLEVVERSDGLNCLFAYPGALFCSETMERISGHFRTLLECIVTEPKRRLLDLPLLSTAERHQLLVEWNDTKRDYPREECIHKLFQAQARKTPEAIAVVFKDQRVSYRELDERANRVAHYLQKRDVGPDVLVGIYLESAPAMIVGLLGVLKAGGAYVPLDPEYPKERLELILEDANLRVLLTQETTIEKWPAIKNQTSDASKPALIYLDRDWSAIARESGENCTSEVAPYNLAYVIYTSGSTGKPKGVMGCHLGVCNYLFWRHEYFPLTETDRLLQKASPSFDDSVWEFFEPLTVGASLVIAESERRQDVLYLIEMISKHQITALCFVPSMLRAFVEQPHVAGCKYLRRVTTGGESLSIELQKSFFGCLAADLHNGYGPTEATISATFWTCNRGMSEGAVPIGQPIANVQTYLLDGHYNPVPIGVTGEIYIGGAGLTRGYLNRPDLTAEKFIPNPFGTAGARLYKTGDLARYRADGNIEFLGRVDHQVKIRGFRIELGEIEAVLAQHPAVKKAALVAREDSSGDKRLVGYVVPTQGVTPTTQELRSFLGEKLPNHMIPSVFVLLESLPQTSSGKIDRRALPVPDNGRPELDKDFVAPRTPIEKALAEIWKKVLKLKQVGVYDNFFDLGGHSLLAIQIISQLRGVFALDLSLRVLFEHPTLEGLATAVLRQQTEQLEQGSLTQLVADLESLTAEQAERLLADEVQKHKD